MIRFLNLIFIDFGRVLPSQIETHIIVFRMPEGRKLARQKTLKFDDSTTLFNDFSSFPLSQNNEKSMEKAKKKNKNKTKMAIRKGKKTLRKIKKS